MPTLVTILNIGRTDERIAGQVLPVGGTLVVDLEDPAVQNELRQDLDYAILPDSAAGTLPAADAGLLAWEEFPQLTIGNGISGGDVQASSASDLAFEGDGVTDYLVKIEALSTGYAPQPGATGTTVFTISLTEDNSVIGSTRFGVAHTPAGPTIFHEWPLSISFPIAAFAGSRNFGVAIVGSHPGDLCSLTSATGPSFLMYSISVWARP